MRSRSLEELENDRWSEPDSATQLVTECHRLRKVPVSEFSVENYRLMLGQNIGTKHLLPLALELLEKNPLAEGDFYPGDLLGIVLELPPKLWKLEKAHASKLDAILGSLESIPTEIEKRVTAFKQSR